LEDKFGLKNFFDCLQKCSRGKKKNSIGKIERCFCQAGKIIFATAGGK